MINYSIVMAKRPSGRRSSPEDTRFLRVGPFWPTLAHGPQPVLNRPQLARDFYALAHFGPRSATSRQPSSTWRHAIFTRWPILAHVWPTPRQTTASTVAVTPPIGRATYGLHRKRTGSSTTLPIDRRDSIAGS